MRTSFDESIMETMTTLGPTTVPPLAKPRRAKAPKPRPVAWSENGSEPRTGDRDGEEGREGDVVGIGGASSTGRKRGVAKPIHKLALLVIMLQAAWAWIVPLKNIATVVFPSTRPDSARAQAFAYMPNNVGGGDLNFSVQSPATFPGNEVVPLLKAVLDIALGDDTVRQELFNVGTFDIAAIHKLLSLDEFETVSKYYALVFQSTEFPGGTFTTRAFTEENDVAKLAVVLRDSEDESRVMTYEVACTPENAFLKATRCTRDADGYPCDDDANIPHSYTDVKLQAISKNTGLENNVALLFVVDYFHHAMSLLFAAKDWKSLLEDLNYNQSTEAALDAGTASVYFNGTTPYLMDRDAFLVGLQAAAMENFRVDSCVTAELVVGQFFIRTFVLKLIQDALIQNVVFAGDTPRIIVPSSMEPVLKPIWSYNISLTSGARTSPVREAYSYFYNGKVATVRTAAAQFKFDRKETNAAQISGSSMRLLQSMVYYIDIVSIVESTLSTDMSWDIQTYKLLGWVGSDITTFRDSFTANSLAAYNLAELPKKHSPSDSWWDQEAQYAAYFKTLEATPSTAPFRVFDSHLAIKSTARAIPFDDDPATRCQRALYKVLAKVVFLALLEISKPASYLMYMGEYVSGDKNFLIAQAAREELVAETLSGERLTFPYRNGAYNPKDDGSAWVSVILLDAMLRYFGKDVTASAVLVEIDTSLKLLLKGSNGNINFPDAASCRVSGAAGTANDVKAVDSLDEVYDKILPGLQASVLDLLDLIPSLATTFEAAMTKRNVPWVTLTRDQILGSAVITSSTEGRGPPTTDWQPTAFTAGMHKFWPARTPTEDAVEKLRASTVCYKMLDTRSWTVPTRCFAEPSNVAILRSQYRSEGMRKFFQVVWSMAVMLNTIVFVVVLKYIRKLYKAWMVTRFECLDVEVALQLNLQGMGVLNISQSLLMIIASLPALVSMHVPADDVFTPNYESEKFSKVLTDIFVTLSMSWFVKLGFDVCNITINPKRPVDWYHLFRLRWLMLLIILVLRLITPEKIRNDSYLMVKLILTCLISLFLGVCCTIAIFLPERGSKVIDADPKNGHDAVIAALVKQNMPLTRYGVLGRTSKGWSKTGLIVEGWRLGRMADGSEVLRKDGGEILLPKTQDIPQSSEHSADTDDKDVVALGAESDAIMTTTAPSREVTL